MLIDIIIYILVAILLTVLVARLKSPLNLITAAIVGLVIAIVAAKFFGLGVFSLFLIVWMIFVVGGLYALKNYFRTQHHSHHAQR
jgi:hypothetical protein